MLQQLCKTLKSVVAGPPKPTLEDFSPFAVQQLELLLRAVQTNLIFADENSEWNTRHPPRGGGGRRAPGGILNVFKSGRRAGQTKTGRGNAVLFFETLFYIRFAACPPKYSMNNKKRLWCIFCEIRLRAYLNVAPAAAAPDYA